MANIASKKQLQVSRVVESAFATAETSPTWVDVKTIGPAQVQVQRPLLDDPTVNLTMFDEPSGIIGLASDSTLKFGVELRGTGTAASNTVAAIGASSYNPEALLMKTVLGGESLGTGSTVQSSSTTTLVKVLSGTGLSAGQAMLVSTGTAWEASPIASISTNDITLVRAVNQAPANSTEGYASATYYPTQDPTSTLQFRSIEDVTNNYQLLGCQGTMALADLNAGQIPKINFDLHVTNYTTVSGLNVASSITETNTVQPPMPGKTSQVFIGSAGSTTRTRYDVSTFGVNLGLANEKVPGVSGAIQGVQEWKRSKIDPVIEVTVDYSVKWEDEFDLQVGTPESAPQRYFVHYQLGATPGKTVFIEGQNCIQSKRPDRVAVNGRDMIKLTFKCCKGSTTTSDLTMAPIRIHLL